MTIRATKNLSKLLAFCLTAALLWGTVCGYKAFLGPGLTDAAALSAEQNQVVFPTSSQTNPRSSVHYKNILVKVIVQYDAIDYLSFSIDTATSSPGTFLSFYSIVSSELGYVTVFDSTEDFRGIGVQYSPDRNDTAGDCIMYCGYNTTDSFATAGMAISADISSGFLKDYTPITGDDQNAIDLEYILMGDINGDTGVTAGDALNIRQFVQTGMMNPDWGSNNFSAGDVDGDGELTNNDASIIDQYVNGSIHSFWGADTIVDIPSTATIGLVNGGIYRLKNEKTGQYLHVNSAGTTVSMDQEESTSANVHGNYVIELNGNLCTIRHGKSNKYLQLDTSYNLTCSPSQSLSLSMFWYLVPVASGGFRIVNYANPQRMLSENQADRGLTTGVWEIEQLTIKIRSFYDNAYNQKYTTNIGSIATADQEMANIIRSVYKVNVEIVGSPTNKKSYADNCGAGVNANCPESHVSSASCKQYNGTYNFGLVHHKNSELQLMKLRQEKTTAQAYEIHVMHSGNNHCGVNKYTGNHEFNFLGGQALAGDPRVAIVYKNNLTTVMNEKLTTLHEVSHCLGAVDEPADTNHGNCVMSYNRSTTVLENYWQAQGSYQNLYCSSCYQHIVNYLKAEY